jgi:precorrin-6B methylase 2
MTSLKIWFAFILCTAAFSASAIVEKDSKDPFASSRRGCALRLRALPAETVMAAAQQSELTPANLKKAEKLLMENFASLPIFTDPLLDMSPALKGKLTPLLQNFSGACSARVVGLDDKSEWFVQKFVQELRSVGITQLNDYIVRAKIIEASENPEIYRPFSMAPFILSKAPSLEAVFMSLHQMLPGVEPLAFPGLEFQGPFSIGPRQMEIVRSALQYSQTRPEDHILEIGYGTPSTLMALSFYTKASKLIGIDPFAVPDKANEILKARNIELVQGHFPDNSEAMDRVKSQGPYSVILSLDTLKPDRNVLETSRSPLDHAKALAELLTEGGVAVIMNDFNQGPYFSSIDARNAGLDIVRWGNRRPLPSALMEIMPYSADQRNAGIMNLIVLRKGHYRADRVSLQGVRR